MSADDVPDPGTLWASSDAALWNAVRGRYQQAVSAAAASGKSKAALAELDRWYMSELPLALAGSSSGGSDAGTSDKTGQRHISRDQLVRLVEWKLARGKWRPRLMQFARDQPAGLVEAASGKALAALETYRPSDSPAAGMQGAHTALRAAVEALTELKGVGPATASALLTAACPQWVPYMSDEALAVALPPGRQSDYTVKAYLELITALQAKSRQLHLLFLSLSS